MQNDATANPSAFRFKSYSNDNSITAQTYPYLYRFDTAKGMELLTTTVNIHTRWDINGSEIMVLTTAGRLGVGTSAPQAKMDVAGDSRVQGALTVGGDVQLDGRVVISEAQGDILMGEFGN